VTTPKTPTPQGIAVFHNNEFVYPALKAAADLHDDDLVQTEPRDHPYPLRRISDVHDGSECGSRAGTRCPAQLEPGRIHFSADNGAGADRHYGFPADHPLPVICHHHGAAVRGHVRESIEVLNDGTIADCSCGAEYAAKQGADEYGGLEAAHRQHVAAVTARKDTTS
jgi:hypothetical protein